MVSSQWVELPGHKYRCTICGAIKLGVMKRDEHQESCGKKKLKWKNKEEKPNEKEADNQELP